MKKILIIVCTALASSANADWKPIGFNKNIGPVIAIDPDRSFTDNGMPVVWWKDFTMGNLVSEKRPSNRPMTIYRTKINCVSRLVLNQYSQSVEVKFFEDPKPEIYKNPWIGPGQWYVPDPGSSDEFVMEYICSNSKNR